MKSKYFKKDNIELFYQQLGNNYNIELHDYDNLCFYKDIIPCEEFIKLINGEIDLFNYIELI